MNIKNLVFVGFNGQVVALDRDTGEQVWRWRSDEAPAQYVSILVDGDLLLVSIMGYTYCLDPLTGIQLWFNPLKGMGVGAACIATVRGSNAPSALLQAAAHDAAIQAATAASAVSGS